MDLFVDFKIWDETKERDPFPYAKVSFAINNISLREWSNNTLLCNATALESGALRLIIPLSDNVWKKNKLGKCILFELSISLSQESDYLSSWLTVGFEGVPYMLAV